MSTQRLTGSSRSLPRGFTLLELTIVLVLASVTMAVAAATFASYESRTAARRAAQVFARDLTLARSTAIRARESVVIRFDESGLTYSVSTESGRDLVLRTFGPTGELNLSAIDLDQGGDSVSFDERGVVDLGNATSGEASFSAGETAYAVTFNARGASRVAER